MEVAYFLRRVLLRVQRSKVLREFIEAKELGLVAVVAVKAVVEAVALLLQTLAEFISTPSMEL
jgi:hypothetical protein